MKFKNKKILTNKIYNRPASILKAEDLTSQSTRFSKKIKNGEREFYRNLFFCICFSSQSSNKI
jgi:hypothetical protein